MLKIGLIVYSCLLLASCATMGNESLSDRGADWPPLEMTKADLLKELGPPSTCWMTFFWTSSSKTSPLIRGCSYGAVIVKFS